MSLAVQGLSISPNARAWLEHSSKARVLHVFDHSCNLISSDGRVISLVSQEIGEGPFTIVVPPIAFSRSVEAESEAVYQNGVLEVGDLVVNTTQVQVWDPCPDWHELRRQAHRIQAKIPLLTDILRSLCPKGGLAEMVISQHHSTPPNERGMLRPARSSVEKLIEGLHGADIDLCKEAAAELAGCGVGLTPEGDDLLLGCLLAVRILFENTLADRLAHPMAEAAAGRTTILSAEWLRSASKGECARPWHALLESLLEERRRLIEVAATTIIRHGHTSGSAALAGFMAVML